MGNNFNKNLTILRKQKGLSQKDLAELINVTHRMITYYENEAKTLPLDKLDEIAKILDVLPGDLINPIKNKERNKIVDFDTKLLKKLQQIKELPDRDQRAISNYINALIEKNNRKKEEKLQKVS